MGTAAPRRARSPLPRRSRHPISGGGGDRRCLHGRATLLLFPYIRLGKAGVGGNNFHEIVRLISGQRDFVNAFPDANAFFRGFQARGLFRQVQATALGGFSLLMHQAGPEIHHGVIAAGRNGAT